MSLWHLFSETELIKVVIETLEEDQNPTDSQVIVVITDDDEISSLNKQFRGIDKTTDVLAFGFKSQGLYYGSGSSSSSWSEDEEFIMPQEASQLLDLGEIFISFPQAERQAKSSNISTSQIRFSTTDDKNDFRMVLPDLHPGPFHPVGGSNIPYQIYKTMNSSAMVMHSISDHSLNLPSQQDVQDYLHELSKSRVSTKGMTCTEPVTAQINKAHVIGIRLDDTALLFLSLSPHGMEDVPVILKTDIEQMAKNRNFQRTLIVDTHNAMGQEISQEDSQDLITAAKNVLDILITKTNYPLQYGYANSQSMNIQTTDLADGGIGMLCLAFDQKKYFLCWADANNMENGIREKIIAHMKNNGHELVEMFTSDTHSTTMGVRNRNGYYELGSVTESERLANWCLSIAKQAEKNVALGKFEILENSAKVRIMGTGIFEHLSRALDSSLKMTQGFMILCTGIFLLSIFLWF